MPVSLSTFTLAFWRSGGIDIGGLVTVTDGLKGTVPHPKPMQLSNMPDEQQQIAHCLPDYTPSLSQLAEACISATFKCSLTSGGEHSSHR